MRIFLSFNSKDAVLAEALRAGIARLEPAAEVFFFPGLARGGLLVTPAGRGNHRRGCVRDADRPEGYRAVARCGVLYRVGPPYRRPCLPAGSGAGRQRTGARATVPAQPQLGRGPRYQREQGAAPADRGTQGRERRHRNAAMEAGQPLPRPRSHDGGRCGLLLRPRDRDRHSARCAWPAVRAVVRS